jgi:hypothetical protein
MLLCVNQGGFPQSQIASACMKSYRRKPGGTSFKFLPCIVSLSDNERRLPIAIFRYEWYNAFAGLLVLMPL